MKCSGNSSYSRQSTRSIDSRSPIGSTDRNLAPMSDGHSSHHSTPRELVATTLKLRQELQRTQHKEAVNTLARALHGTDTAEQARCYCRLGEALFDGQILRTRINGVRVELDKKTCFTDALRCDARCAAAYDGLGDALGASELMAIKLKDDILCLEKVKCHIKAIAIDANNAMRFVRLGNALAEDQHINVSIGGDTLCFNRIQCYITATDIDPTCVDAQLKQLECIPATATGIDVVMPAGDVCRVDKLRCCTLALSVRPHATQTLFAVAARLKKTDCIEVPRDQNTEIYSKKDCLVAGLLIEPNNVDALHQLAELMSDTDAVSLSPDGHTLQSFDQRSCYTHILGINRQDARAWYRLGNILSMNAPFEVNGQLVDKRDCFRNARRFSDFTDPMMLRGLAMLAYHGAQHSMQGLVSEMNKKGLLSTCIPCQPILDTDSTIAPASPQGVDMHQLMPTYHEGPNNYPSPPSSSSSNRPTFSLSKDKGAACNSEEFTELEREQLKLIADRVTAFEKIALAFSYLDPSDPEALRRAVDATRTLQPLIFNQQEQNQWDAELARMEVLMGEKAPLGKELYSYLIKAFYGWYVSLPQMTSGVMGLDSGLRSSIGGIASTVSSGVSSAPVLGTIATGAASVANQRETRRLGLELNQGMYALGSLQQHRTMDQQRATFQRIMHGVAFRLALHQNSKNVRREVWPLDRMRTALNMQNRAYQAYERYTPKVIKAIKSLEVMSNDVIYDEDDMIESVVHELVTAALAQGGASLARMARGQQRDPGVLAEALRDEHALIISEVTEPHLFEDDDEAPVHNNAALVDDINAEELPLYLLPDDWVRPTQERYQDFPETRTMLEPALDAVLSPRHKSWLETKYRSNNRAHVVAATAALDKAEREASGERQDGTVLSDVNRVSTAEQFSKLQPSLLNR